MEAGSVRFEDPLIMLHTHCANHLEHIYCGVADPNMANRIILGGEGAHYMGSTTSVLATHLTEFDACISAHPKVSKGFAVLKKLLISVNADWHPVVHNLGKGPDRVLPERMVPYYSNSRPNHNRCLLTSSNSLHFSSDSKCAQVVTYTYEQLLDSKSKGTVWSDGEYLEDFTVTTSGVLIGLVQNGGLVKGLPGQPSVSTPLYTTYFQDRKAAKILGKWSEFSENFSAICCIDDQMLATASDKISQNKNTIHLVDLQNLKPLSSHTLDWYHKTKNPDPIHKLISFKFAGKTCLAALGKMQRIELFEIRGTNLHHLCQKRITQHNEAALTGVIWNKQTSELVVFGNSGLLCKIKVALGVTEPQTRYGDELLKSDQIDMIPCTVPMIDEHEAKGPQEGVPSNYTYYRGFWRGSKPPKREFKKSPPSFDNYGAMLKVLGNAN